MTPEVVVNAVVNVVNVFLEGKKCRHQNGKGD